MNHSDETSARLVHPVRHSQIQANGAWFHVVEQGQGPAVLFLHGFPDTVETWRSQMQVVADNGYHAIALDMRGFGDSYSPDDPELYSGAYIAGDLIGILDSLKVSTATIVAHDWGADHGQRAMVMRPDRFNAIVTLSIPFLPRGELSTWEMLRSRGLGELYYAFDMMKPEMDECIRDASKSIPSAIYWLSGDPVEGTGWDPIDADRHMFRAAPDVLPNWADPAYVKHNVETFQRTGFRGGLNHYRGAQKTFEHLVAFKGVLIKQPSLYIWGDADGLCRLFHPVPPTVEEMRETAPAIVDVVRLEGVGHWPQHEARDRVNAEIINFLNCLNADRSTAV
ncbi:alpha/beta fold hydrolase [Agrobacterium pusense]|uniref:alpha/beta fold hydrolase n=1 Tax=Agrobacterium pusense TaxID=648995 RepID=UPI001C6E0D83|nr:alpha/beta hydrolase [Agrobacterium pusense]MBW9084999.1 alpha/beta hydrolase [Agrobacterium pusense]MBW9125526.1 alpha/beta hydrolase [Agrobacterium pusense]MBW9137941.1 alpha/beta hydrolase [Agrobacterium pusense]